MSNKRSQDDSEEIITNNELKYILEVNKKAIEINIEVEKQNEEVISSLEDFKELAIKMVDKIDIVLDEQREHKRYTLETKDLIKENKDITDSVFILATNSSKTIEEVLKKKIEDIEKTLFKLVIILGSAGVGAIATIIQSLLRK